MLTDVQAEETVAAVLGQCRDLRDFYQEQHNGRDALRVDLALEALQELRLSSALSA